MRESRRFDRKGAVGVGRIEGGKVPKQVRLPLCRL